MSRTEAWLLHVATLLLALSGLAFAASKYLLPHDDPFSAAGSHWEPWALAAHVLLAPAFLFGCGLIFKRHVLGKLRDSRRDGRRSGLALVLLLGPLSLSGYLLQVATGEGLRRGLALAHLGGGVVLALAYAAHAGLRADRPGEIEESRSASASALAWARRSPRRPRPSALDRVLGRPR